MPSIAIHEEDYLTIVSMYAKGSSCKTIAQEFKVASGTVLRLLRELGVDTSRKVYKPAEGCLRCSYCLTDKTFDNFNPKKNKRGYATYCKECVSEYDKQRRRQDGFREKEREKRKLKRDAINASQREWKKRNPDKVVKARAQTAQWKRDNSARVSLNCRERYCRKLNATPSWADKQAILKFYETAQGLSMLLGEWYHVDHVVPLKSDFVCGLHCENNLQVLLGQENLSKSNIWWPDMWESEYA